MSQTISSKRFTIKGIVQGVGFRPHVYRLAVELGLKGWVLNSSSGVFIEVEGLTPKVDEFIHTLLEQPPPGPNQELPGRGASCTELCGFRDFGQCRAGRP